MRPTNLNTVGRFANFCVPKNEHIKQYIRIFADCKDVTFRNITVLRKVDGLSTVVVRKVSAEKDD